MDTRREFIKKSLLLSGAAGVSAFIPASVQRAFAIDPKVGSTYLDAEHIVILMQENRSFDHCFGSMKGVRGFNDPRAITLPNINPVWLQTDKQGKTFAPFRLNIRESKATWIGDLPHSRPSQVDANNEGKYDQWLTSKRSGRKQYADMPLTLGYYTREDLPFNYALADAFTVCDQNFSSAMTSTWPNRLFFWTGTIRQPGDFNARVSIRNDLKFGEGRWKTFPERLEEKGISWNVYQNDITCGGGFEGDERSWLSNFGCNPLELFSSYNVRFSERYVQSLQKQVELLPRQISELQEKSKSVSNGGNEFQKIQADIRKKQEVLDNAKDDLLKWSRENFEKLSDKEKSLYQRAFSKNDGDPYYHQVSQLKYDDGNVERNLTVPKGDVLHRFRQDVNNGKLPTVSWLVGPQNFSDHPSAPWYGAWYVSEVLDILTKNPEVWKKTIFILTYDENDGYFDHVPPYTPPDMSKAGTGKCSKGIDTEVEHVRLESELRYGIPEKDAREAPVGLGYRVPLVIASPWSRGGKVCSQIFDHTSTLQFMEDFINRKFGVDIRETNLSQWRRTVCGDLKSVFSPYNGEKLENLPFLTKEPFIEKIHKAQYKKDPNGFSALSDEEISQARKDSFLSAVMPKQEKGIRPSCALPYQLYADGRLDKNTKNFVVTLEARNEVFGQEAKGSPFRVYARGKYTTGDRQSGSTGSEVAYNRNYAVEAGNILSDTWPVEAFEGGVYHLRTYGPNGFYRGFKGDVSDPDLDISCEYERSSGNHSKLTGNVVLKVANRGKQQVLIIKDQYNKTVVKKAVPPTGSGRKPFTLVVNLDKHYGWYDLIVEIEGRDDFERHYAGRVETGKPGFTDPLMGGIV